MKRTSLIVAAAVLFVALNATGQIVGRQDITTANLPNDNGLSAALPFLIPVMNLSCQNFPSQVTFRLYPTESEPTAVWEETQTVVTNGGSFAHNALMGLTTNGLPIEVFSTGRALWLGVQCEGEAEQSRMMMTSVPYALKSLDAKNLGGRPASDYALAGTVDSSALPAALGNETSRAEMVEANLVIDLTSETINRQSSVTALQATEQANVVHTDGQLSTLKSTIAVLETQMAALQVQIAAMQALQTGSTSTGTMISNSDGPVAAVANTTIVNQARVTNGSSARTSRSSRITASNQ